MFVASEELSRQLFEVSGWDDTTFNHMYGETIWHKAGSVDLGKEDYPLYDLGFLLRKLPKTIRREKHGNVDFQLWFELWQDKPCIGYMFGGWQIFADGDTPVDAAALLCINLFKKEILTK